MRRIPLRTARALALTSALISLSAVAISGCKKKSEDAASSTSSATGAENTGDIVLGAYVSLTGSTADFGTQTKRGYDLAIDELNANGGVLGRKVRIVTLDTQGKADEAGNAVTRLIDVEHVVALVGEVQSTLSMVGGRIAQRRQIPMVTPSSTNVAVTAIGDYVFRVCFIDPFQGYVMARFARDTKHFDRIAIFKDVRSDYSKGLAEAFRAEFTRAGGQVVSEESYNQGDTDFAAQLTTIKATDAQAMFIPGYYTEVGNVARQARRLGLNIPLLGGDGWEGEPLHTIGGQDILGSFYSSHYAPDVPGEKAQAFLTAYRNRYQSSPTSLAAQGYDAALLIADAIRRAGNASPTAIREALARTQGFQAVTGIISMDEHRNPIKPAVVLRVGTSTDAFETVVEPQR